MTSTPTPSGAASSNPASGGGAFERLVPNLEPHRLINWQALYSHTLLHKPEVVLTDDKRPYMHRWFIRRDNRGAVYLHRFLGPDPARAPHDHPYDFTSIMLFGGYTEVTGHEAQTIERKRGDVMTRRAEDPHTITNIAVPGNTWTLVLTGPRFREWGFHTKEGWVRWQDYDDPFKATVIGGDEGGDKGAES